MMTRTERERRVAESLPKYEDRCREAGLKLTQQRQEVFQVLALSDDHPPAEAVFQRVRERLPHISKDTVYRALSALVDLGLAIRVAVEQEQARYDCMLVDHHHFTCIQCQAIWDFDWPEFDELPTPNTVVEQGSVLERHVVVRGVCAACRAKEQD